MPTISNHAYITEPKSPTTATNPQKQLQTYLESVPKNLYKAFNRWLILPELNTEADCQAVAAKIKNLAKKKGAGFRGDFIPVTGFGKHSEGDKISFTLLDPKTPVGQIKKEISKLTNIPVNEIGISFLSMRKLDDETIFTDDLNCHGKGGERFWIRQNPASPQALQPKVWEEEAGK